MLRPNRLQFVKLFKKCLYRNSHERYKRNITDGTLFRYTEEVAEALRTGKPVVALESTIITHGMPHPHNLSTALEVENVVRKNGAVPATIAIINGKIHIGLSNQDLERLSLKTQNAIKTSRRDLPVILSQGLNGGTTVSGTMLLADRAGIPVFVTGGIGGVHRGAEKTMDVSADLTELGRTPVAVISAGVKSILDIGKTLEYLETQGVCVATYGPTCDFPGFFTAKSGFQSPYNVTCAHDAAKLIAANQSVGLQSGILIGVPIPADHAACGELIEAAILKAVSEAENSGITGKEVTPYILQRVFEITEGKSLDANVALIKNNAKVGSEISVELAKLKAVSAKQSSGRSVNNKSATVNSGLSGGPVSKRTYHTSCSYSTNHTNKRPVVIGGSNVDFVATIKDKHFQSNGATYPGSVRQSFGGVGRNIADCLSRLGTHPLFISAVGQDSHADAMFHHCSHMDMTGVARLNDFSTATYCAVLKHNGELLYGIGDFDIHKQIKPEYIDSFEEDISKASLVCTDGNIAAATIEHICEVCHHHKVPVWYEPTDILKADKPFRSSAWRQLSYISPNLNELRIMHAAARGLNHHTISSGSSPKGLLSEVLEESIELCKHLVQYIPNICVTLGRYGLLLCRSTPHISAPFPAGTTNKLQECSGLTIVHYPTRGADSKPPPIVSVSGAGDCLVAAMISGIVQNQSPDLCVKAGLLAASYSLTSYHPVSTTINSQNFTVQKVQQWAPWQPNVLGNGGSLDDVSMWAAN